MLHGFRAEETYDVIVFKTLSVFDKKFGMQQLL